MRVLCLQHAMGWLQHSMADAMHTVCAAAALQQASHLLLPTAGGALQQQQQQRHKHTVRMVLLKDHERLGSAGDIVEVKAGHARYTLFPSGQADYAVPSVVQRMRREGLLTEQALEQLRTGFKARSATGPPDPSTLPVEQQLPQIVKQLSSAQLVVSRGFNRRLPEQPMVGAVTPRQLAAYAERQLHIRLPPELILMDAASPIQQYGSYRVPLNLRDEEGRQVELSVLVRKTYRGRRTARVRGLFAPRPAAAAAAAAAAEGAAAGGQAGGADSTPPPPPPPPHEQQQQQTSSV